MGESNPSSEQKTSHLVMANRRLPRTLGSFELHHRRLCAVCTRLVRTNLWPEKQDIALFMGLIFLINCLNHFLLVSISDLTNTLHSIKSIRVHFSVTTISPKKIVASLSYKYHCVLAYRVPTSLHHTPIITTCSDSQSSHTRGVICGQLTLVRPRVPGLRPQPLTKWSETAKKYRFWLLFDRRFFVYVLIINREL